MFWFILIIIFLSPINAGLAWTTLILIGPIVLIITLIKSSQKKDIQEKELELYRKRRYETQQSNLNINHSDNYNYYETQSNSNINHNNEIDIDYSKFYKKNFVMTPTELKFYRKLKIITDKLQLTIFPEVDLERIIKVHNDIPSYRNRIKSRSIDFTIVNNYNYEIVCCIELDDYSHNRPDRQKRDEFINKLFFFVGLKLYRIPVENYNIEEIEENLRKMLKLVFI